ncbi:phage scaffolding protein [Lactobacillus delbrueckii]|uniref:phage scaffolding protein n=1 Tax=Lactobacillus delbrueckii TaxID=1584 RepID=UPI001E450ACD|nr:phage scaffolding protein [Lactobacillus delbrueckii]MCD5488359.1 phage scaffolding protein [Lactobacillus delbrueckii subsp. lactis]
MERKFLTDLGLDSDQVNSIMAQYGKDLQKYEGLEAERDALKKTSSELSSKIEDLKANNANVEDLTKQIEKLKSDNENAAKQLNAQKLEFAVTSTIKEFGAKNAKAVKALLNHDDIRFDSKGNLTGLEEQLKSLKDSDGYLFAEDKPAGKPIQAFPTGNPEAGGKDVSLHQKIAQRLKG